MCSCRTALLLTAVSVFNTLPTHKPDANRVSEAGHKHSAVCRQILRRRGCTELCQPLTCPSSIPAPGDIANIKRSGSQLLQQQHAGWQRAGMCSPSSPLEQPCRWEPGCSFTRATGPLEHDCTTAGGWQLGLGAASAVLSPKGREGQYGAPGSMVPAASSHVTVGASYPLAFSRWALAVHTAYYILVFKLTQPLLF